MTEKVRKVMRELRIFDCQRALDSNGCLVLGNQQAYGEDDHTNERGRQDAMGSRPVLPLRSCFCRHRLGQLLQPERRTGPKGRAAFIAPH